MKFRGPGGEFCDVHKVEDLLLVARCDCSGRHFSFEHDVRRWILLSPFAVKTLVVDILFPYLFVLVSA